MCCTRLAENTGRKNDVKKSPSAHHRTTLLSYIFTTKACIDNRKKSLLNSNSSSTIWQTSAHWRLRSFQELRAAQQISTCFASWLFYCSDISHRWPTKLCTMFGRLLG